VLEEAFAILTSENYWACWHEGATTRAPVVYEPEIFCAKWLAGVIGLLTACIVG
jgi:hypothetical protein